MLRKLLVILIPFLAIILFHQPVFAKDQSFTMVCQGGGGMTAVFDRKIRFDNPDLYITTIHFAKAPKAAGQQAPGPGQCAWLDRPISSEEPALLVFQRKGNNPVWQLDFSMGNIVLKSADREEFALLNAVHRGEQIIIKAKRDGDVFRITNVGP